MNLHEVAADLDQKSIQIIRLLLREERHLNPGIPATLITPTVKEEYGWTNQTVLRRFRKLRDAGLVRFGDVDSDWPEHDRYPRPPKAIERRVEADELREVLDHWDGRETRSPSQLTDDLGDLDHRLSTIDDRLTERSDATESKLNGHLRQHATTDRRRVHRATHALYLSLGALAATLVSLVALVVLTPGLLTTVLLATLLAVLVGAVLAGASSYALTRRSRSPPEHDGSRTTAERSDSRAATEPDDSRSSTERGESQAITE
jgi:hypothetical protein